MTTRILFLAKYRVPHACFSMQWDHMLQGINKTIIATPLTATELEPIWKRYGIDSSTFEYINDDVIYQHYPEVNNWVFADDYRGWWLRQQAIKLAYLDYLNYDVALMQDPDTFMIRPYKCYNNGRVNMLALENTAHGSYNGVFESITGLDKQSLHCFITELVAVRKQDFISLRKHIEQRWPDKKWLDAIIESVPGMPTVPPWGNGNIIKWFSEYELLGNWALHCGNIDFEFQRRYEYTSLVDIAKFESVHNAVCDAVPDLSQSMQLNWDTGVIDNFEYYVEQVNERLRTR